MAAPKAAALPLGDAPTCQRLYFITTLQNAQTKLTENPCFRRNKGNGQKKNSFGNDLLSQGATPQVPSALADLTAGFGMEPGMTPPLKSPKELLTNFNAPDTLKTEQNVPAYSPIKQNKSSPRPLVPLS
jgi:hypothetical protein